MPDNRLTQSMDIKSLDISGDNHRMRIHHRREERQFLLQIRQPIQPCCDFVLIGRQDGVLSLFDNRRAVNGNGIGVVQEICDSAFHLVFQFCEDVDEFSFIGRFGGGFLQGFYARPR